MNRNVHPKASRTDTSPNRYTHKQSICAWGIIEGQMHNWGQVVFIGRTGHQRLHGLRKTACRD